jgi:hypothetical protein
LLPPLLHFGDHLTPAILLSMNTGLRRGEVFKLRWACVDFNRRLLTVEGQNAKNRQTRHVPLNEEAVSVLRRWREWSGTGTRVFDVVTGFRTAWGKLLERARISNFRWHDAVYTRTLDSNNTPSSAIASKDDWERILRICMENRETDFGSFMRRHLSPEHLARLRSLFWSPQQEVVFGGDPWSRSLLSRRTGFRGSHGTDYLAKSWSL